MPDNMHVTTARAALRQAMTDHFSIHEIKDICFDLNIDAENLDGTTKSSLVRELLARVEQRTMGVDLMTWLHANRSDVRWPNPFAATYQTSEKALVKPSAPPTEVTSRPSTERLELPSVWRITTPVAMELVRIPVGEFPMGSDPTQDRDAYEDEQPQHRVYLSEFYIARTPVTNLQFEEFVRVTNYLTTAENAGYSQAWTGDTWERTKGANWRHPRGPRSNLTGKTDHPVVQVSWYDAVAFCDWLTAATGSTFRLPTEAEWEKAARGILGRIYPWGDNPPTDKLCNFDRLIDDTTPVEQYFTGKTPDFGLLDMAGNVLEWVADWYDPGYYSKSSTRNPLGPAAGKQRGLRGGSWYRKQELIRAATRHMRSPSYRVNSFGFRCACSA